MRMRFTIMFLFVQFHWSCYLVWIESVWMEGSLNVREFRLGFNEFWTKISRFWSIKLTANCGQVESFNWTNPKCLSKVTSKACYINRSQFFLRTMPLPKFCSLICSCCFFALTVSPLKSSHFQSNSHQTAIKFSSDQFVIQFHKYPHTTHYRINATTKNDTR